MKICLFALLLGFTAYNKFKLTPPLLKNDSESLAPMRRSIAMEYILYVLILGAAATLTAVMPPRVDHESLAASAGFKTTVRADHYTADLEVTPGRAGENMFMVVIKDDKDRTAGAV